MAFSLKRRSVVCSCPACGREEKLYILRQNGGSKCFRCGKTWGLRGIIFALTGKPLPDFSPPSEGIVARFKEEEAQISALSDADFQDGGEFDEYYFDPSFVAVESSERAVGYLLSRGASNPEIWVRHGLLYQAGLDAIVAPVVMHGVPVGYQARFIEPKNPNFRMKSSDGLPRERALYNYDNASRKDCVLIVEGIFDCINSDVLPGVGSCATMGKLVSRGQIELLKAGPWQRIYIGLDRDAAAQVRELETELCGERREVFRVFPPPDKKDFGECTPEEVAAAIAQAQLCTKSQLGRLEVYFKS